MLVRWWRCMAVLCGLSIGWFSLMGGPVAAQENSLQVESAQVEPAQVEPAAPDATSVALDRRFTYQGRLVNGGVPVNGSCDLRFTLFDAASGGTQVGAIQTLTNVAVSDGLFSVTLNAGNEFGSSAFTGQRRWLAVAVRCPAGSGSFTTLSPRQELTPAPYALYAVGIPLAGSGSATSAARSDHHHFGQSWSGTSAVGGLLVTNTATTGVGAALHGVSESVAGRGVFGWARHPSGNTFGVFGRSDSTSGRGVFGRAVANSGANAGVEGFSDSTAGYGVRGVATALTGLTYGVAGESYSSNGLGVYGWAAASGGVTYGVFGRSDSTSGGGVFGLGNAASGMNTGVLGRSESTQGTGVRGVAAATSGNTYGVAGESNSPDGLAVYGWARCVSGFSHGVYGRSDSTSGRGVTGLATAGSGETYGVRGENSSTQGVGVYGYASAGSGTTYGSVGHSESPAGVGVFGVATAGSGVTYGVFGRSDSPTGRGVYAQATAGSGVNYGIFATTNSPSGFAGYFQGNVVVTGSLSKGSGSFRIDHPLDPANRYLSHSFVESPDMLNVYNGNVILDAEGAAWVELPAYFEALNRDFRYQLTPIGAPGPNLYIAARIENNRFRIAGGTPGLEVSWQVTGIRQDPYARAYPIIVEEDKPAHERGTYLHPELYGATRAAAPHAAANE